MPKRCNGTARLPEQGFAPAEFNLGAMYYYGQGVQQDFAEAQKWTRKAAEQGMPTAQNYLGLMYVDGPSKDYAEAVTWFRRAADQGDADGELNLGLRYDNGEGVPQDYAEAMKGIGSRPTTASSARCTALR